ncbi:enoyl-CoA hydratase-related protein [Hydrogenophaga sp.]|uniref:enoyl-CoA hydratase-related protein n=1 Tax=Hydrogenophaga sp. TaxID=1904254 RepID=UPI00271B06F4|nr:enoyl-CoA hydratase-related protein [Hydrogenophaga sp.]MDO9435906.1 enoyl-CoA hydratase-related protein [Hydrogenophaga sp.]
MDIWMNGFEHIRYEVSDGIATVTLNRPEVLNAQTRRMQAEVIAAADLWDQDDAVRAVIFTGAGKAYSAGTDLGRTGPAAVLGAGNDGFDPPVVNGVRRDSGGVMVLRLYESSKPLIAAVNGAAVGVGATMLLPMDFRIASENARFGFVFTRRGIVPESCSSWFLPRVVGITQALDWFVTGKVFPASKAQEAGLVSEVVPAESLLARAHEIAREIADHTSPVSVALTRHMAWSMLSAPHPMHAHVLESRLFTARRGCPDTVEGVKSFLEKRKPQFPMTVSSDMPKEFPWWETPSFDPGNAAREEGV